MERLCRHRRARQNGGHPGQRPRLVETDARRHLRRARHDLLRPLDLQVRRGGAARCGRRDHRARHRTRRLWLERGRILLDRPAAGRRVQERRRRPEPGDRLDAKGQGRRPVPGERPGFRAAVGRRRAPRLSRRAAVGQGERRLHQHDRAQAVEERGRRAARPQPPGRGRALHRPLGPSGSVQARTRPATTSATARSTTPAAWPA